MGLNSNGAIATSAPSESLQPVPQKRNTGQKGTQAKRKGTGNTPHPTRKEFTPPHKEKHKGKKPPQRKNVNTGTQGRGREARRGTQAPAHGSNAHRTGQGGKEARKGRGREAAKQKGCFDLRRPAGRRGRGPTEGEGEG